MSHAAHVGSEEKPPLHKRIKRFGLFEWTSVKLWLFGLLIAHFWAIKQVITESSKGEGFDILGNMFIPTLVLVVATNRSALEENKHHGDKWMMIGTIFYGMGLATLMLFMNGNTDTLSGITWLVSSGGLLTSLARAGGHHH